MGQIYSQLTKEDRHLIASLRRRKLTQAEIAREVGCSTRTIRRELKRGQVTSREYNARDAHQKRLARRKRSKYLGMKIDQDTELASFIVSSLESGQRPESIAGRIRRYHPELTNITAKSIYNWLYAPQGQRYAHLLPSKRYKPKKQSSHKTKRELIPDRTPLTERPLGATNRTRHGHTASDTMVSGKKTGSRVAIAGTIERKLRYVTLSRLNNLKPDTMSDGLRSNFRAMGIKILTDTKDNGIENRDHKTIEQELGIKSFFCDPYSSWQKGEIENIFKLVRAEGIPKGMDLSLVSEERLQVIQDTLNNRWRKSLGYRSPAELMARRRDYEQKRALTRQQQHQHLLQHQKQTYQAQHQLETSRLQTATN